MFTPPPSLGGMFKEQPILPVLASETKKWFTKLNGVTSPYAHRYLTRRFQPVLIACDAVQSPRCSRSDKCPQVVVDVGFRLDNIASKAYHYFSSKKHQECQFPLASNLSRDKVLKACKRLMWRGIESRK